MEADDAETAMVLLLPVADAVAEAAVLPLAESPMKPDAVLAAEEEAPVSVSDTVEDPSEEVAWLLVLVLLALLLVSVEESTELEVTELETTELEVTELETPESVDVATSDEMEPVVLDAAAVLLAVVSEDTAVPCRRYSRGWLSAAEIACWCISR